MDGTASPGTLLNQGLRTKISQGYFYSDNILNKIVDEIAEVLSESAGCD